MLLAWVMELFVPIIGSAFIMFHIDSPVRLFLGEMITVILRSCERFRK